MRKVILNRRSCSFVRLSTSRADVVSDTNDDANIHNSCILPLETRRGRDLFTGVSLQAMPNQFSQDNAYRAVASVGSGRRRRPRRRGRRSRGRRGSRVTRRRRRSRFVGRRGRRSRRGRCRGSLRSLLLGMLLSGGVVLLVILNVARVQSQLTLLACEGTRVKVTYAA